jgi:hypothetical protein
VKSPPCTLALSFTGFAIVFMSAPVRSDDGDFLNPSVDVSGFASARLAFPPATRSKLDGGFGKLRYGGDNDDDRGDVVFNLGEAAIVGRAELNPNLGIQVHLQHQREFEDTDVGIVEGFAFANVALSERWELNFDGGAVFPDIMRENRDIAWANAYTLTNSPAATWIGEEVRPIGGRAGVRYTGETMAFEVRAGPFIGNDIAGLSVKFGGWALNDLKTPLNGKNRLPVNPPFRQISDGFGEIDDRVGYQVLASADSYRFGGVSVLWWDNRGDITASDPAAGDIVWDTSFLAVSGEVFLPGRFVLLPSFMVGETQAPLAGTEFGTASLLLSRDVFLPGEFGSVRFGVRADVFTQNDTRAVPFSDLSEDGAALTTSARWTINEHIDLTGEMVYVRSERAFAPNPTDESLADTLFQVDLRAHF